MILSYKLETPKLFSDHREAYTGAKRLCKYGEVMVLYYEQTLLVNEPGCHLDYDLAGKPKVSLHHLH